MKIYSFNLVLFNSHILSKRKYQKESTGSLKKNPSKIIKKYLRNILLDQFEEPVIMEPKSFGPNLKWQDNFFFFFNALKALETNYTKF